MFLKKDKYKILQISRSKLFDVFMFVFLIIIIILLILMPVSELICHEKDCWNFKEQGSVFCEKHNKIIDEENKKNLSSGSGAVSYTHLKVICTVISCPFDPRIIRVL